MKKIYIAGKVTDLPYEQVVKKFKDAADDLSELGYNVFNPVQLIDKDATWHDAMRKALRLLLLCDEIALLPDWKESNGARIEYFNSQMLNMPILLIP